MTFLSPLWLIGLVPWAAVALYLLWGRRRQQWVPFLDFWIGPVQGPRPKRRLAAPPVSLAAALLAPLLALLAAAGPRLAGAGAGAGPVTVIVDVGASMSARGVAAARFVETAHLVGEELLKAAPQTPLEVYTVAGSVAGPRRSSATSLRSEVGQIPRTAVDSSTALRAAFARALADTVQPVVVISDLPLGVDDRRVVQVAPESAPRNAALVHVAVREAPTPQAMVRVRNDTTLTAARLDVTSGGATSSIDVRRPAAGEPPADFFVDVPQLGDIVAVRLDAPDDFEADNVAWLVREGNPPRLEPRGRLSPELARMVEVYGKSRAATESSSRVAVVGNADEVPQGLPAIVISRAAGGAGGGLEVSAHPVTRNMEGELAPLAASLSIADGPGADWTPVARVGGKTAVAVRERPARQVWVGFDSPEWARRPGFVVFWANVFDWVGGSGGTAFRGHPVGPLGGAWRRVEGDGPVGSSDPGAGLWPGLYQRDEDGARRGVNALEVQFASAFEAGEQDWRRRLAEAVARSPGSGGALAPWLLVAAIACIALAALGWRRRVRHVPGRA